MDPVIISRVENTLFALRVSREAQAYERRQELFAQFPRLKALEAELGSTAAQILRAAVADGEDYRPKFEALEKRNLEIQAERAAILASAGLSPDALEPARECRECGDTGILPDGRVCACFKRLYRDEQLAELERWLPVRRASFEAFDETLYSAEPDPSWGASPRENAVAVRDACRALAEEPIKSENILICGGAGVGKTFLAAAVAVEASAHAYSVCCRTAAELVSLCEREKFTYDDDVRDAAREEIDRLLECDLLIIDDLGAEFRSAFASTALLGALSPRIIAGRRTLVCTTLDEGQFAGRYIAELASRLTGEFEVLPLFGEDLRKKD